MHLSLVLVSVTAFILDWALGLTKITFPFLSTCACGMAGWILDTLLHFIRLLTRLVVHTRYLRPWCKWLHCGMKMQHVMDNLKINPPSPLCNGDVKSLTDGVSVSRHYYYVLNNSTCWDYLFIGVKQYHLPYSTSDDGPPHSPKTSMTTSAQKCSKDDQLITKVPYRVSPRDKTGSRNLPRVLNNSARL